MMNFIVIQMTCHNCGYVSKPPYYAVSDDNIIRYTLNCDNCRKMHTFNVMQGNDELTEKIISALEVAGYQLIPF